jgi:hypothetical protein
MIEEFGPNASRIDDGQVGITSPLLEAIRAKLPDNVRILLQAGADRNGVALSDLEEYSALFLRFRPQIPEACNEYGDVADRETLLKHMEWPQMSSLTYDEIEDRMVDGLAPFWCEENFTAKNYYRHGDQIPSLVAAAASGSVEIFDILLQSGADASFWMRPQFFVPRMVTHSSLCVSSPVHVAIENGHVDMIQHLLKFGFYPNVMPLANPTRCLTPLMTTIIQPGPFNKTIFDILAHQPGIQFNLRTPIYDVHLLHLAVAKLDLPMLQHITSFIPLHHAGLTALKHTLLHIACLPKSSNEINRHSKDIHLSIHETRDLDPANDPFIDRSSSEGNWAYFAPSRTTPAEQEAQTAVVKYLWDSGTQDFAARDVHGNTALHYLAGCVVVNWGLIEWLRSIAEIEVLWTAESTDEFISPQDLVMKGEEAMRNGNGEWKEWFEREWTRERVVRRQEGWSEKLGYEARRSLV